MMYSTDMYDNSRIHLLITIIILSLAMVCNCVAETTLTYTASVIDYWKKTPQKQH